MSATSKDRENNASFLSDVKTLRERARKHIEEGAVTDSYEANRETVLKLLNEALATELVCVLRYKRHYYMAQGIHSSRLRKSSGSMRWRSKDMPIKSPSASFNSAESPTSRLKD